MQRHLSEPSDWPIPPLAALHHRPWHSIRAQLSIAYAADEMPFESRHFMSNGCFNIECRFEIFLRRIGHQWCENHLV
jgi:hypothetical protein